MADRLTALEARVAELEARMGPPAGPPDTAPQPLVIFHDADQVRDPLGFHLPARHPPPEP